MARISTRKETKIAETVAYLGRVKSALDEAHIAARAAFESFKKTAELTPDGHIVDVFGSASVVVYKPSYKLRTALKSMNEVMHDYNGAWHISNFTKRVTSQSVTAQRIACEAACAVLERHFPNEGEFITQSRRD